MFAVECAPILDIVLFAKGAQGEQVTAVILAGFRRQSAFCFEMPDKPVCPAAVIHRGSPLVALQCACDELAQSRQEIDAHTGVKSLGVVTANRQEPDVCAF